MRRLIQDPRYQKVAEIALALIIWLTYSAIGPGGEFFNVYRDLVFQPAKLIGTFGAPITYNPPWLAPMLAPVITMPGRSGYIIFIGITLLIFLYASSVFESKPGFVLISAQLFWILWWGQIEGLVVLGIALGWAALKKNSWKLMILAICLAALKPQIGLFPIVAIWWWSGKDRWKSLLGFVIITIISIWIYGPWPLWFIRNVVKITNSSQYGPWNSSLGLWAIPLLLPALGLKMDRYSRLIALTATGMLISPYMPYYSTILLFCYALPGWSAIFAMLGYFPNILGTQIAWNGIVFLPITLLIWLYWPYLKEWTLFQDVWKRIRHVWSHQKQVQMNPSQQFGGYESVPEIARVDDLHPPQSEHNDQLG
jgi:hypothetical protein